jgi:hypothetical protein
MGSFENRYHQEVCGVFLFFVFCIRSCVCVCSSSLRLLCSICCLTLESLPILCAFCPTARYKFTIAFENTNEEDVGDLMLLSCVFVCTKVCTCVYSCVYVFVCMYVSVSV